jgi:predicted RNase H-like nuclease (RuvC/YqgF family)
LSDTIECMEVLKQELENLKTQFHEADRRIVNLEVENASLKLRIEEESKEIEALKTEVKFYSTGEQFGWELYHGISGQGAAIMDKYFKLAENFRRERAYELRHRNYRLPNKETKKLINAVIGMATSRKVE